MADQAVEEGGFIHVGEQKVTEEDLRRDIQKYKEQHSALKVDIAKLEQKKWEAESLTQKIHDKVNMVESTLLENEQQLHENELKFQESVRNISLENQKMKDQAEDIKEKIVYFEQETKKLEDICASGMERKTVFKGKISDSRNGLSVKHQIRYPVSGGTALITFEEPAVAAEVIVQKHHKIKIEECFIHVKAEPVELLVLDSLSMDMNVSSRQILVSNLPTSMSEENLLDKLELFFSKAKNSGGEVDDRGFIPEFKSAFLSFLDEGVAPSLVGKKTFAVPFGNFTHTVQVSPALKGNLTNHQMKHLVCNRTVLLTSIPDIMDADDLQDLLELHFQKSGEVQALLYCAEGQNHVALFEDDEKPSTQ